MTVVRATLATLSILAFGACEFSDGLKGARPFCPLACGCVANASVPGCPSSCSAARQSP